MNSVDKQYIGLLKDILKNGVKKHTRAGDVLSVFGRTMRFDLNEGIPLITTKKVYHKGCIIELLWFLSGNTNIKYLVENNVHIWDDDAYRYYKELIKEHNYLLARACEYGLFCDDLQEEMSKEEFLGCVKNGTELTLCKNSFRDSIKYRFGDLGDIYGKQWRCFGTRGIDQINNIIETLKSNPDDRRMLCVAYNPDVLDSVALPPCHVMFQFYTRELSKEERVDWLCKHNSEFCDSSNVPTEETLNEHDVPIRELSCSFFMRSNDFCCGNPFNIFQYAVLTYMIAEICNMSLGELVYFGGDVHVYENHIEKAKKQIKRKGSDIVPTLRFARNVENISDFKYEDFIIENYNPDEAIKYELNVG